MKNLFLSIAILLTIFVIYFGKSSNPDVEVLNVGTFHWGFNYTQNLIIKIGSLIAWSLFIYKLNTDGNKGSN